MGNKTYRVTLVDSQGVERQFITTAWTCDHASANAYEAYGMKIRIRAIEIQRFI
jgi:hypothetical protein